MKTHRVSLISIIDLFIYKVMESTKIVLNKSTNFFNDPCNIDSKGFTLTLTVLLSIVLHVDTSKYETWSVRITYLINVSFSEVTVNTLTFTSF